MVDIVHKLKSITPQFHTNTFEAFVSDLKMYVYITLAKVYCNAQYFSHL